jgi:putative protein-disulfide isomerase
MPVRVRYFTDPACPASWAAEPHWRRLMVEFGADVQFTYVMGGLAREFGEDRGAVVRDWLEVSSRSGMPVDPLLWFEAPPKSTYPACMAVKAAAEQAEDGGYRYLRALREGWFCFRRKLDTVEALVEEARAAGLDAERFRIDLGSHAIVEAFGADLEQTRAVEGLKLPTLCATAEDGSEHWAFGGDAYDQWRAAALDAGASPSDSPPSAEEALRRFGRVAAVELEQVGELPGPRAAAELWGLALEWRARPRPVLAGVLFEAT